MFKNLYALLFALGIAGPVAAAPPTTLGYQGRLATSGGQPVSGIVTITFRVYDVASGGSALWTESQNNVVVDGGNVAVELGKVTPLPLSIFGRQLYVGVQLAGDSEMLPRPPLTAAPFALRAGSTFKNTIFVSAEGTPTENGTALLAAVASAASATAQKPVAIELDAGTYDLGSLAAIIPPYVTLNGRSQEATTITSSNAYTPVLLGSNTSARDFTSRSTGTPVNNYASIGLIIDGATPATPVDNVRLERVTGISTGPSGANGARWGIYACATNSHISDVTGIGQGGQVSAGLTLDCAGATNNVYEGIVAYASGASNVVTGIFIGGGGAWRDFKVSLTADEAATKEGLRVIARNNAATAPLSDVTIHIKGTGNATGVFIEPANVDLERVHVNIDTTGNAQGVNINANPGSHVVRVIDSDVEVSARGGHGLLLDAAPQVSRTKIVMRCLQDTCWGIENSGSSQGDTLALEHVDVTVDNNSPGAAYGYAGAAARITNSTLHVLPGPATTIYGVWGFDGPLLVSRSSLVVEDTVAPGVACVIGAIASSSVELYGSAVRGTACIFGGTASCAGNTKLGTGFLASTCP